MGKLREILRFLSNDTAKKLKGDLPPEPPPLNPIPVNKGAKIKKEQDIALIEKQLLEVRNQLTDLEADIEGAKTALERLEKLKKHPVVKENIETLMTGTEWIRRIYFELGEQVLARVSEYNASADFWNESAIDFTVSNAFSPHLAVHSLFGVVPKAIKFIEGEGYGRYEIYHNSVRKGFFTKRKGGNEDGVLLLNQLTFLSEYDHYWIRQASGSGEIKCVLLFIYAGMKGFDPPLEAYEQQINGSQSMVCSVARAH